MFRSFKDKGVFGERKTTTKNQTQTEKPTTAKIAVNPDFWVSYHSTTDSHRTMTTSPQSHTYAILRRDMGFIVEPRTKDVQPAGASDTSIFRGKNGRSFSTLRSTKQHLNHHPKVRRNNVDTTWATVYGDKAYASKQQIEGSQSPRWIGVQTEAKHRAKRIYH